MKNIPIPQIASIEQPFGMEPPVIHCPICGNSILETEDDSDFEICKHTAFIYISEISEFEYQSDDFQEKIKEQGIEDACFEEILEAAGYGNNLLVIDITYGGMACGPVWYNLKCGFDFGV